MYESESQKRVSHPIIAGEADRIHLGVTDNFRAVTVQIDNGEEAAYTAEEARELADSLKTVSDERWEGDNDDTVEYLRDLAAVVDREKDPADVAEKWEGVELDTEL
jgi:hypothetical protein